MAARALAANGAKVYIAGRRTDVLEASAKAHGTPDKLGNSGGSLVPIAMDITSKESLSRAVAEISAKDGFVNVYGLLYPHGISEYL